MDSPIPSYVDRILYPLVGTRMLELGNKVTGHTSYKSYFESIGIDHTSIDMNGLDGALKIDLCNALDFEPFDMVTNFGTTEHVRCQEAVWRNIHNMIAVGGVLVSMTPMEGDWSWHGEWYPRPEFYHEFANNGYKIEYLDIGRKSPNRNIDVRMTKINAKKFVMPDMDTIYHNVKGHACP